MILLDKCLEDVAKFLGASDASLKIGPILIQWGTSSKTLAAKDGDSNIIKFAKKYSTTPVVFAQSTATTNYAGLFVCGVKEITATQFGMTFHNQYSQSATITGNWFSIGKA